MDVSNKTVMSNSLQISLSRVTFSSSCFGVVFFFQSLFYKSKCTTQNCGLKYFNLSLRRKLKSLKNTLNKKCHLKYSYVESRSGQCCRNHGYPQVKTCPKADMGSFINNFRNISSFFYPIPKSNFTVLCDSPQKLSDVSLL